MPSEHGAYREAPPGEAYLKDLLSKQHFIAIVATRGGQVIGGLTAYELEKFEQRRSEIYLYDLAVESGSRRGGVATELIARLQEIAAARGAFTIFVQAGYGDDAAIALYNKLGTVEKVLHFDIPVAKGH